jgi:aspartate aminotransferase
MPRLIADREVLRMTSELAQVIAAARERERAGGTVMHLERGEPDFDTPPHVVEALAAAARAGETHYPEARGSLPLREALVEKLARENHLRVHVDDLVITSGGTHALYLAFQALMSAGDEVLVLSPHWMAIPKLVGFASGAHMRGVPAFIELGAGTLAPAQLADRLRAAISPATRGIYLNTPNNPTGVVLDRDQLAAIAAVAIERDLWVISDEAYEHLLFDGARHFSIGALPGMAERTLSVYTFSKSYAMTGWRIGYIVTPAPLRPLMGPLLSFYTTNGIFPSVQSAARAAVTGSQAPVEAMRSAYEQRRDLLLAGLEGQGAIRVPAPRGAFYAFADVRGAMSSPGAKELWELVFDWLEQGVAVLPGTAFGAEYTHHVRLSLATRREDVAEAARRLRECVLAPRPAGR